MFLQRIFTICKLKQSISCGKKLNVSNIYIQRYVSSKSSIVNRIVYTTNRRNISFQNLKKPNIEKLRLADKIPNNYELIYRCTMSSYLYAAQISATFGIIFVCVVAGFNFNTNAVKKFQINYDYIELQNLLDTKIQVWFFSIGFILINVAAMILVSKFPVRIYFSKDLQKYKGILHGIIPKTKKIIEFSTGDVLHTPVNGILPWSEFRYKLKCGKNIIILDHYFRKPDDMNIMLGYTKL